MQQSITQLFCLVVFSKSPKRLDLILQTFSKFNCFLFTVAQYNSFEAGSRETLVLHTGLLKGEKPKFLRCAEEHRTTSVWRCVWFQWSSTTLPRPLPPPLSWNRISALLTHRTKKERYEHEIKSSQFQDFILTPKLHPLKVFRKVGKDLKGKLTSWANRAILTWGGRRLWLKDSPVP